MLEIEQVRVSPNSLTREFFLKEPAEIELIAGDKRLIVGILAIPRVIICDTRTYPEGQRIPGATTLVYRRAFELMKECAAMLQTPLTFHFDTSHPAMKAWALDPEKGYGVFNWDYSNCEYGLTAKKVIYP